MRLGLTEKESISNFLVLRFLTIVVNLERANQLSPLPDKDLVDLYLPIEPYQVTKTYFLLSCLCLPGGKTSKKKTFC